MKHFRLTHKNDPEDVLYVRSTNENVTADNVCKGLRLEDDYTVEPCTEEEFIRETEDEE